MEKKEFIDALKAVKLSNKRKFSQNVDLIINLKGLDFKKEENKVDFFLTLPFGKGKKQKVCALVDKELTKIAKENCDYTITREEFSKYASNPKQTKRIARDCSFFIAQANIMGEVAKNFGKVLGVKGKMPNPKAGCVVPPEFPAFPNLIKKLQNTARILTKNEPTIKVAIGTEAMKEEELAENIMVIYNQLIHALPQQENNIKDIYLKLTMGPAYKMGKGFVKKVEEKKEPVKENKEVKKTEEKSKLEVKK